MISGFHLKNSKETKKSNNKNKNLFHINIVLKEYITKTIQTLVVCLQNYIKTIRLSSSPSASDA